MVTKTSIRWLERVNRPYEKVREALSLNANQVFHMATSTAESRAKSVAADLHAKIAGFEFRKDILIKVRNFSDFEHETNRKMIVDLEWKAADTPFLFPTMSAELYVFPAKERNTHLDFRGEYEPPLGFLGQTIDTIMGRTIAEACVHHFVAEVAQFLHNRIESD